MPSCFGKNMQIQKSFNGGYHWYCFKSRKVLPYTRKNSPMRKMYWDTTKGKWTKI